MKIPKMLELPPPSHLETHSVSWGDLGYSFTRVTHDDLVMVPLLGRLLSAIRRKALHGFAACNGRQPEQQIFWWILGCPAGTGCKWIISPLLK